MPGFKIGGTGEGPSNSLETLRENRWLITEFGPITDRERLLIAKEVGLPDYSADILEVLGGLIWYKYAKGIKWKDINVVFYDDGKVLQAVQSWKDLVYTNDGGIQAHNPGSGYKKDCTFELLDGMGEPLLKVKLKQAWPSQILTGKLSYTSSEIKIVTVILSYDFAEIE